MKLMIVIFLDNYYSPFYHPSCTIIDSFHCSGNSSLFQIQLISLWISERNVFLLFLIPKWTFWKNKWAMLSQCHSHCRYHSTETEISFLLFRYILTTSRTVRTKLTNFMRSKFDVIKLFLYQ
jgi:hypothetical protein